MQVSATEKTRRPISLQGVGPNWILVAGGALLSTLSVRLLYKLKQVLASKQTNTRIQSLKGTGKPAGWKKSGSNLPSDDLNHFQDIDCYNQYARSRNVMQVKQHCDGQTMVEPEMSLPLVTLPTPEFNKDDGLVWSSSPNHFELPQKPFHQSNFSESPSVSESGSDILGKREVIQKLRQQLKRRDDTILEMQYRVSELQNSCNALLSHSSHLQSQLDGVNRDLFDSEREIKVLRKAVAGHCIGQISSGEKSPTVPFWSADGRNDHANEYLEVERNLKSSEKIRGDKETIELLKGEVRELKELIDGKDYLLQSYKEQKSELSMKIKELQQRLDSQLPNIL